MKTEELNPDYLFEVSWEVCNKVGGIHTVISTKALTLVQELEDRLILIGPDLWKGPGVHPEFEEDKNLFPAWKAQAEAQGIRFKTGRWRIAGSPVVLLLDFTSLFSAKNEIFSHLWVRYKLDSLAGQWDYIEPALFGYAAGRLIESFYQQHLTYSDKIIAHFHEWLTGAGILYLNEKVPQVGTVFTTHATVVGRAIAGNGLPLYASIAQRDAEQEARKFNVTAKHSLERKSAEFADCFTTVSEITGLECGYFLGRQPDVITPNGFDESIVPDRFVFSEKRSLARSKLLKVASALLGRDLPDNSLLILKSGRYEFRNKGLDVFIKALRDLPSMPREVVAFIFIPAATTGYRKDLQEVLELGVGVLSNGRILTHHLQGAETDAVMTALSDAGLNNDIDSKVNVIFSPVYLNGSDGIYNISYYDLLPGFDLSVFPSYYEPWGYTPLESMSFYVPTVTTGLAGFGVLMKREMPATGIENGVEVIERTDNNDEAVVQQMNRLIQQFSAMDAKQVLLARNKAHSLAHQALWKNLIAHYRQAYSIALKKADARFESFAHEFSYHPVAHGKVQDTGLEPGWRGILIETHLPEKLSALDELARNLWWTWNPEAEAMFAEIDPENWQHCKENPLQLINNISAARLAEIEKSEEWQKRIKQVHAAFKNYMNKPMNPAPLVAYFCMEYGLHPRLRQYSGGLGILAGDYLKEASDSGENMVGVGLLYRNGFYVQEISMHGDQEMHEEACKFSCEPLLPVRDARGKWLKVSVALPGRTVFARIRKTEVGRVTLYLLDADIEENLPEDRKITATLYGGDRETRLKQELLLGVGGVRTLQALGIQPDVYHLNEGHVAFAGIERLRLLMYEENLNFEEALEVVRGSSLFTTHTPVPAGHDVFTEEMLRTYLAHHAKLLNMHWSDFMQLGRMPGQNGNGDFSMSIMAANICQEINGVSLIHQGVSRKMFAPMWKGYGESELHIGHVTNGIHPATWVHHTCLSHIQKNGQAKSSETQVSQLFTDEEVWDMHLSLKEKLVSSLKYRFEHAVYPRNRQYKLYSRYSGNLNKDSLILAFARRMVTYKRPTLLFQNLDRLYEIVQNSPIPLVFLFAGKAHPNDSAGAEMIRQIVNISTTPEFKGRIFFLQDYDMPLAKEMVQGVDVWLNFPESGMEASGSSGMKSAMNGGLQFSVADGWWAEMPRDHSGWVLPASKNHHDRSVINEWDADLLYNILQNDIIPLFGRRNNQGFPEDWVKMMRRSMSGVYHYFNTSRMLNEYDAKYYQRLAARHQALATSEFEKAKELALWKQRMRAAWNQIRVVSTRFHDSENKPFPLGTKFTPRVSIDIGTLHESEIGVELVFIKKRSGGDVAFEVVSSHNLGIESRNGSVVTYSAELSALQAGVFEYAYRLYPVNENLPHRQDFPLITWV